MQLARKTSRALVALTVGAGLPLTIPPAHAGRAAVGDPAGDSSSRATDITRLAVRRGAHRVVATVTIPSLVPGRLSGTELLLHPRGRQKVYAIGVMRDRQGRLVAKDLSWRPLNDPIEPVLLPCAGIRTRLRDGQTVVSVPQRCLSRSGARAPIRAKVRTVDGTVGLEGAYFNDQTRFTRFLRRR